jgi:hypothetical protein
MVGMTVYLALLVATVQSSASVLPANPVMIVEATVCDLLSRPLEFANRHVRVRAATSEGSVLFPVDDACSAPPSTNGSIWLELPPTVDIAMYDRGWSAQRFIQALGAGQLKGDGPEVRWQVPATLTPLDPEQWKSVLRALDKSHGERVQVVITGRFDFAGDGLLVRSPRGDYSLWGGFGHMGSWPQRIVLERIEVATGKQ